MLVLGLELANSPLVIWYEKWK